MIFLFPALRTIMFLFFALAGVAGAARSSDQPTIQLRIEAAPRKIHIGDVIRYEAVVTYSNSIAPAPVDVPKQLGEFEVLQSLPSPPRPKGGDKMTVSHSLLLTTFSTGTQTIPSLTLKFSTIKGEQAEAKTEPIEITVLSLLEEKGDLGGLRPPKGFFNFRSYLWAWILALVLLIAGAAFWIVRSIRRKKEFQLGVPEVRRPPEETAWESLLELEMSGLITKGQIKEFYYRLSVVFRRYLEERFQMSALDRTTSELLSDFRRMSLPGDISALARQLLENADLVKFAKFTPQEEEIEADLDKVKDIITMTTPQKQEKPEEKIPV